MERWILWWMLLCGVDVDRVLDYVNAQESFGED